MLNALINKLQATFPPNRIVLYLTPIVIAPAAATAAVWLQKHFPGLPAPSTEQLTATATAAALSALTLGFKYLDGWQKHEARQASSAEGR